MENDNVKSKIESRDSKTYFEHPGKVVETGGRFKHVMAIALDSSRGYKEGVIRCITSREGDVGVSGYVDRSELFRISAGDSLDNFSISEKLKIENEETTISEISKLGNIDSDFIGFEDPDLFFDTNTELMHLYFTMPFLVSTRNEKHAIVHLGQRIYLR